MFAPIVAVVASLAQPQWIAPPPAPLAETHPHWIWAATEPAPTTTNAPRGNVWLARSFELPHAGSGTLSVAADNAAIVYLNGTNVLESSDWSSPVSASVSLHKGRNLLCIEANNGPLAVAGPGSNPAGVAATLVVTFADGSTQTLISDAEWTGATAAWDGFPTRPPANAAPGVIDLGPSTTAPWNVPANAFAPTPPCPMLRKSFTLDAAPKHATVRVIGLGHYELRCNSRRVGDSVLNQTWSQYDKTIYWQDFDLAPYLKAGENVIAVTLGNSFWQVAPANDAHRFTKTDAMPDFANGWPHLLWLDAQIETDAVEQRVSSDQSWTWAPSPVTFSNLYAGEDYDARLEQPGWDAPGFDDAHWAHVAQAPAPAGQPTALIGPGIQTFETFAPVEIKPVNADAGIFTYVFGQNCSALLRVTLDGGRAGSRIRFRPCEYMEPDGRVRFTYTWGTGKDIWLDYTKRGDGPETHEPLFFYVGAQFVQIEGAVPEGEPNPHDLPVVTNLELVHVRAACEQVGTFESSSPMHDAAERLIDWSIRSNMSHVPTDCPHREKNGWQEENWHMARACSYRYDTHAWLVRNCRAIRDAQTQGGTDDGFVPTNTPWYLVGRPRHDMFNDATEWGISSVLVPWHLYEWYGDRQIIEDSFDSARRYVDYLSSTAKDGIITSNLGDWYDFGHGKGNGPSQWTPNEVSATAIWALGADTVARMAEVLGREREADQYQALFEQIRTDFQRHFYDPTTHTVKNRGSCQAGTSTALCVGLIPEKDRDAALDAVVSDLEARGWKQTPGEVLQVFLIRALGEAGRGDVLHRIYNREDIPSYGHMVNTGLTTLPESWDARRGTGDSLNHFMLGHLMEWHYAYVAGIRQAPGSVGWSDVVIAPQPPSMLIDSPNAIRAASATFDSPRGRIASSWSVEAGVFSITCEIPEGLRGRVRLPDGSERPLKAGVNRLEASMR